VRLFERQDDLHDSDLTYNVALLGITGALGKEIQSELEVEYDGIEQLFAVAGLRSVGQEVRWRGTSRTVTSAAELTPADVDFALFATPPEVVVQQAQRLLDAGARVIDASGALAAPPLPKALTSAAPVVWPRLSTFPDVDLEAAIALVLPSGTASTLAPLFDALTLPSAGLPRLLTVTATVLLPASHAGREGIAALSRQAVGLLNFQRVIEPRPFPAVLAFNVIAPAPAVMVLFEAHAVDELRGLVPRLGPTPIELQPIWIPAFSGIVVSLQLRFDGDLDPLLLERVLAAHPDLDLGRDDDPQDEDRTEADEGDQPAVTQDDPEALSLREVTDRDEVRVGTPIHGERSVRLVLMADPIHRTAQVAATLLKRWMATLEVA